MKNSLNTKKSAYFEDFTQNASYNNIHSSTFSSTSYKGNLTSRQCGNIVKDMIIQYEKSLQ